MQKLAEKYTKMFTQEAKLGYENKAVWGGLQALGESWSSEARENGVDESLIPQVKAIFDAYPNLDGYARREALLQICKLLSIPLPNLPEANPGEKLYRFSPPSNEPKNVSSKPYEKKANKPVSQKARLPHLQVKCKKSKQNRIYRWYTPKLTLVCAKSPASRCLMKLLA